MTIQQDIAAVLAEVIKVEDFRQAQAQELADSTGLSAKQLNTAVSLLEDSGYVKVGRYLGGAPYTFTTVEPTPQGRWEFERALAEKQAKDAQDVSTSEPTVRPTTNPVGSPFGFTDLDWEYVGRVRNSPELLVVFGRQFKSPYYDTNALIDALLAQFQAALSATEFGDQLTLRFLPLHRIYGEHLFNAIAREILASDISVFDTSDHNANVMIEMGVALTHGIRVYPIRELSAPPLPSDLSGLMWARYTNSGAEWEDANHFETLVEAVDRAARKKLASPRLTSTLAPAAPSAPRRLSEALVIEGEPRWIVNQPGSPVGRYLELKCTNVTDIDIVNCRVRIERLEFWGKQSDKWFQPDWFNPVTLWWSYNDGGGASKDIGARTNRACDLVAYENESETRATVITADDKLRDRYRLQFGKWHALCKVEANGHLPVDVEVVFVWETRDRLDGQGRNLDFQEFNVLVAPDNPAEG